MSSTLNRLLSRKQVKHLADERSFTRGQDYFQGGRVRSLVVHGDTLTAMVVGTEEYEVRLAVDDDTLRHRCSCPVGGDGAFCKHCVAVALAWLHAKQPDGGSARKHRPPNEAVAPLVSLDDLRPWLLEQSPATLAGHLLEAAERDDRLREKLLRAAARATGKGIDLPAYRRSLDRATRTGGFVDYYGAGGYADGVREALDPLRELLADAPERAGAVVDLAEFALKRVEDALENADDSNGEIGTLLGELQELHLAACRVAKPDPEELARRLFAWETDDHWDVFHNAAETYAQLLGARGLATYQRLAEVEWEKLPPLGPGAREDYDRDRFRLTHIMEALARVRGDLDALVAIKAKDLSHAYAFLQIAQLCREARRHDEALAWAERGLKSFPTDTDARLLEFLAAEYHRRGRHDDAIALGWRQFEERPALESYRNLKTHADRATPSAWPACRERALALLRQRIAGEKQAGRPSLWSANIALRSTLVEIFLWENDPDAAWREAQSGACRGELMLRLAAAREKTHPADAIPIHLRHAETLIAQKNNRAYEEAARHLKKVKSLHLALDQPREWAAVHARLCTEHKAKRNLMALIAGLS